MRSSDRGFQVDVPSGSATRKDELLPTHTLIPICEQLNRFMYTKIFDGLTHQHVIQSD
jgi:hypothetical protein